MNVYNKDAVEKLAGTGIPIVCFDIPTGVDVMDIKADVVVTEGMGAFDVVITQRMYRQDQYKYVFNGAGEDQLFDLEEGHYEMDNLVHKEEKAELLLKLKSDFADWMSAHGDIARHAFCKINRIKEWEL